jgi:hypothetical protein
MSHGTTASGSVQAYGVTYNGLPFVGLSMYGSGQYGCPTLENVGVSNFSTSMHTIGRNPAGDPGTYEWSRGTGFWMEWVSLGSVNY